MDVSLSKRWVEFVDGLVTAGRYRSSSEVVHEGLRLVAEREAKLAALRETIDRSIERGGSHPLDEIEAEIDDWAAQSRDRS